MVVGKAMEDQAGGDGGAGAQEIPAPEGAGSREEPPGRTARVGERQRLVEEAAAGAGSRAGRAKLKNTQWWDEERQAESSRVGEGKHKKQGERESTGGHPVIDGKGDSSLSEAWTLRNSLKFTPTKLITPVMREKVRMKHEATLQPQHSREKRELVSPGLSPHHTGLGNAAPSLLLQSRLAMTDLVA